MSTADVLRAEGRVEGRVEGRLEALRESLLDQLELRFAPVDPAARTRIERATNEQLVTWLRRFAVGDSVDAIFSG